MEQKCCRTLFFPYCNLLSKLHLWNLKYDLPFMKTMRYQPKENSMHKSWYAFLKKKGLLIGLMSSYILILVVPVVFGIIVYLLSADTIKQQVEAYNSAILFQAQRVMDERLSSIEQTVLDISKNSRIQRFVRVRKEKSSEEIYLMGELVKELEKYPGSGQHIKELYIYFRNSNTIAAPSATYDPLLFHSLSLSWSRLSYEDWMSLLNRKHFREYLLVSPASGRSHPCEAIYLQTIPIETGNQGTATLVATINIEGLNNLLKEIVEINQGCVYVVDPEGRIITSLGDKKLISPGERRLFTEEQTSLAYEEIDGKEVVISQSSSKVNNWTYVSVVPSHVFLQNIHKVKQAALVALMAALTLSVILAVYLTRKNFAPIQNLARWLAGSVQNIQCRSAVNELEFIKNTTLAAINESKTLKHTMHQQLPILRANLLQQYLKGTYKEHPNLQGAMEPVQVAFPYADFCVMLFTIEYCKDIHLNQEWGLVKFVVSNVSEELGNESFQAYAVDLDWNLVAFLVNLNLPEADAGKEMQALADRVQNTLSTLFSIEMSMGIGNIHPGLEGIHASFQEAEKALEYKMFLGSMGIMAYSEMKHAAQQYYYPFDVEMELVQSVKKGDYGKTQKLLEKIYQANFRENNLSFEMAHCLYADLAGTAIKVLGSLNIDYHQIFGPGFDPYKKLTSCTSISEIQSSLQYTFESICKNISLSKQTRSKKMISDILEHIETEFSDQNISLYSVAMAFNTSPTYLSQIFKEQVGTNFIDYLREKRVAKALTLLQNPVLSLEQIAQEVGYVNSSALIRNFKRVKNMTPGQFRESGIG